MKFRFLSIPLALLILLSLFSGCSQSGSQSMNSMLKLLPDDAYRVICIDWDKLKSDRHLEDLCDETLDAIHADYLEDYLEIDPYDISLMILARSDDAGWTILKGDFDLDRVRSAFDDLDMDDDEYRGIEIWEGGNSVAAFINGAIVFTTDINNMKDVIKLNEGDGDSVYDDDDYQAVINKLPSGVFTFLSNDENYDSRAEGFSFYYSSGNTMEFVQCLVFTSERKAESNQEDIEYDAEYWLDASILDVDQQDNIVELKGELDIDDFIDSYLFSYLS